MTWQNILLKQLKFPVDIEDWVGIFESENTLNKFKRVLQQYVDIGPNELQGANDNTLRGAKQDLNQKEFANTIVSEAGFDNKPILGQQPTGKKSDKRIVNQVQLHLKEILDSIVGSFGTTKSEKINKLLDSIGPKLKENNPNDYLEIEQEISEYLGPSGKVAEIKRRLHSRVTGKIREIIAGVSEHHSKNENIPNLFKLFNRTAKGDYSITGEIYKIEGQIKFYRIINSKNVGDVRPYLKLLKEESGVISPYLYTVTRELTNEFKKALRNEPVSLQGFEQFMYVKVPVNSVDKNFFADIIEYENNIYIPFEDAEDYFDDEPPKGLKGLVDKNSSGQRIVDNGESILGKELPLEKEEVLEAFKVKDENLDDGLKYWAFNKISKVKDWEKVTIDLITKILNNPSLKRKLVEELEKNNLVKREES